ncbi:MAG: acetylglutamate kinase [Bacteroidota bacterium]
MKEQLTILKIGGKVIEDEATLAKVLADFKAIKGHKILVHGGGKKASQLGEQMGHPAPMVDGRRITDDTTLEIVTMVYAGLYNKKVVSQLQAINCNALGVSGADANLIKAHKRIVKTIDYGFAGDIDKVDQDQLHKLLVAGVTPVFCAITHNQKGQLLNTNADTIASTLARAMSKQYQVALVLCLDLPGVMVDPKDATTLIPQLDKDLYQGYKENGTISGGMLPKLDNAFEALNAGVEKVRICGPHNIRVGGTTIQKQGRKSFSYHSKGSLEEDAIELLKKMIETPSLSRNENHTADLLEGFLLEVGIAAQRQQNNVWARSRHWDASKPTVLLNSHHDTVKPAKGWQRDPFKATLEGEQLFGLGSNDAGASLMGLMATFRHFYDKKMPFNLVYAATAEEEISGPNGIASLLPSLGKIDTAIVGEPTEMQMAIAEKGLMVIDGEAIGQSGHAARNEGINALYIALDDIKKIQQYSFDKVSPLLGPTKATVTQVNAGSQHNVVPDRCTFVIDVRTNELYSNQEAFELLDNMTVSNLKARSFRLNSSGIPMDHPLVISGLAMSKSTYGSPTLSDQALMPFSTLKIGIGDSARSHTADEYIYLSEIRKGIKEYIQLLEGTRW